MDEIVPVILGALFAAFFWYRDTGRDRLLLSVFAVVASAATAIILSGEYLKSWIYLLLDLGEASLGLAVGLAIAHRFLRSRRIPGVVPQRVHSLPVAPVGPDSRPGIASPCPECP